MTDALDTTALPAPDHLLHAQMGDEGYMTYSLECVHPNPIECSEPVMSDPCWVKESFADLQHDCLTGTDWPLNPQFPIPVRTHGRTFDDMTIEVVPSSRMVLSAEVFEWQLLHPATKQWVGDGETWETEDIARHQGCRLSGWRLPGDTPIRLTKTSRIREVIG